MQVGGSLISNVRTAILLDGDMAQSAIRNLNGFEFGGRTLRVDKASSQADELRLLHQQTTVGAPTFETVQSANITPDKVPEVIARTIGTPNLPPSHGYARLSL